MNHNNALFSPCFFFPIVLRGNSHNLMKASAKRRRSKRQIEEEKVQAEKEARDIKTKLAAYEEMKKEMQDFAALKDRLATQEHHLKNAEELTEALLQNGVLHRD